MTIQIKLDAAAITKLIENDETFELELQRAVVAEIVRKVVDKDAKSLVKELQPVLTKKLENNTTLMNQLQIKLDRALSEMIKWSGDWPNRKPGPSETVADNLRKAYQPLIDQAIWKIKEGGKSAIQDAQDKAVEAVLEKVDERIERQVTRLVAEEVDQRVVKKLNNVLQTISDGESA